MRNGAHGRRRRARISPVAGAVLAAGLVLSLLAFVEVRDTAARAEARDVASRARTTTNLFTTVAQGIDTLLTTGGVVARATNGDPAAFGRAIGPRLTADLLSNAALLRVTGRRLEELAWTGPAPPRLLRSLDPAERAAVLAVARTGKAALVARREVGGTRLLAIAAGGDPASPYVVYAELSEPRALSFGSLGGLQFAFYVGSESPQTLVATNARTVPIGGTRLVQRLNVDGFLQQPVLVYGGLAAPALETAEPWLALGGGLLLTLLAAGLVESSRRRRARALALIEDLEVKNGELDRQAELTRHQALHDALTGLPNRSLFHDRIAQAVTRCARSGEGAAVALIDLDHFKEVNDTLGHQCGDRLLRSLGDRLRLTVRSSDTVARLGGDEFGVLLADVSGGEGALAAAAKVREALREPTDVDGVTLEVDASIGIALLPRDGDNVDTLLRHADIALYRSKAAHTPTLYATEHDHYSPRRLQLASELRGAIADGQIVVLYQPQARLRDGRIVAVEALVRWQHPELGLLGPDRFVPLAEHTGTIRQLTRHVLDQALAQCRAWLDRGFEVGMAVNVSARDLLDASFRTDVIDSLRRSRVPAQLLQLELTENTILNDSARARAVIMSLRGHGVRFAIDDFGAGHSSLAYLKRLPVHALKIDKSFVLGMDDNEDDAVIVRSTIDLGHNLRLQVVAEGVETAAIRERLVTLGCDVVQGFELARPLPAEEVERMLTAAPAHVASEGA